MTSSSPLFPTVIKPLHKMTDKELETILDGYKWALNRLERTSINPLNAIRVLKRKELAERWIELIKKELDKRGVKYED